MHALGLINLPGLPKEILRNVPANRLCGGPSTSGIHIQHLLPLGKFSAAAQLTIPAKQQRIVSSPNCSRAFCTTSRTPSETVTSHGFTIIFAAGKSVRRDSIAAFPFSIAAGKSSKARPERPCSRRARAEARASTPVPPVTIREEERESKMLTHCHLSVVIRVGQQNIPTAFPFTVNRIFARCWDEVLSGNLAGGGVRVDAGINSPS